MYRNTVVLTGAAVLSLVCSLSSGYGRDYNYGDLGQVINNQVRAELNSLGINNLGSTIRQRVRDELKPLETIVHQSNNKPKSTKNDYGFDTNWYNDGRWYDGYGADDDSDDDDGDNYSFDLGLDNLGDQIQHQVEMSLRPVRAMEMKIKMKSGVGGTTVATFSPSGRKFIIRNNVMYECQGYITRSGECSGSLERFNSISGSDVCYIRSYSQINNQICLSPGPITFASVNGVVTCNSIDRDTPARLLTTEEYNRECQGVASQVTYRYYANENDSQHVQIPNSNPYVTCSNNEPGICEFTESNSPSGGNIQINNGNVQINGGGTTIIRNGIHTYV